MKATAGQAPPAPPAPWHLAGEALLAPGWLCATALVHYTASPVGPYNEYAKIRWPGGPSVVKMLVNSQASVRAGRELWGFPKEYAEITWERTGNSICCHFSGHTVAATRWRAGGPLNRRIWVKQTLGGKKVRVPCRVRGRWRLAWCKGKGPAVALEFTLIVEAPLFME
jgi:hypothetical protein